jgi:hypothetical protein
MSAETDRHDQDTLVAIGRNPGCKRKDFFVNKAAVTRLIRAGLVKPPSTNGRLYLTPEGEAALG